MKTGIVVIGRNEGQRLVACLGSLVPSKYPVVYIDSGSSDGSLDQARNLGVDAVALDMSIPFTAARARNAGLARLNERWSSLLYAQFVDGDCVVVKNWIAGAEAFLDEHPDVAVVCGRRREMLPNATIYNRLCDIEWDTPLGNAVSCGGDALMRLAALRAVKGYCDSLIAAEDSELCLRLRQINWKIWRLPNEMTLHDANIQRFSQWWKRAFRGGFAYAAVFALHARSSKRIFRWELVRSIFWGLVLPISIFLISLQHLSVLWLLLTYPLQIARIAIRRGAEDTLSWQYGVFITVAKFAEAAGILNYLVSRLRRQETRLIEYK